MSKMETARSRMPVISTLFGILMVYSFYTMSIMRQLNHEEPTTIQREQGRIPAVASFFFRQHVKGPCAINLYGLPRKFKDLTLPSLIENVIKPNAIYKCDYYVHYYDRKDEHLDRGVDSGRYGSIDSDEVLLLKEALSQHKGNDNITSISFVKETEEEFFTAHKSILHEIETAKGKDGKLVYVPDKKLQLTNSSLINIIKMWNSQESVWDLMESAVNGDQPIHYSRVAMLRSDVLYVTPLDIYGLPDGSIDTQNQYAVIPNFENHPVNDRMIYGPYDAVRIWAAGRFQRLQQHGQTMSTVRPRYGIHSERYLYHTIFPAIRDAGVEILADSNICFLRVRSDYSIRFSDCGRESATSGNRDAVEYVIKRKCALRSIDTVDILECGGATENVPEGEFIETSWEQFPPEKTKVGH